MTAELWAISLALKIIDDYDIKNVTIESNCLNAVTLLSEATQQPPWWASTEVLCCRSIMELHPEIHINFVRRMGNKVAHLVASQSWATNVEFKLTNRDDIFSCNNVS